MTTTLRLTTAQHSDRGFKAVNQDFHGMLVPEGHQLATKGAVIAMADGISSSKVSQIASESAVAGFLNDYLSTPDSWPVKLSAERVLQATNAWLHAQTRQSQYRYDRDRGYLCTLSVLILKSATAYLFNVGDTRIYRIRNRQIEQLTTDHRLWLSNTDSCLTRAMGMEHRVEIDYRALPVNPGDTFLLATDGVHEYLSDAELCRVVDNHGSQLELASRALTKAALDAGSDDNLSVQLVRVDAVASSRESTELHRALTELPCAPELVPGQTLDGYRIVRQIHGSSRSHVFQAVDIASQQPVALKTPSMELRQDADYLEQFAAEEWIARRINNPHVVRPFSPERQRSCVYLATEFIEARTLKQWMLDHPKPALETVRGLIEQIARGLRAFHRMAMVHQDLKPENILVDAHGKVTLIDFGATRVTGLQELQTADEDWFPRGAALYSAPETFIGETGTWLADQFSLGVITYQLLTGQLPFGAEVPKIRSVRDQRQLTYQSARALRDDLPIWLDDAIARAVHPDAHRRYPALSEFLSDLRQPGTDWQRRHRPPLMERHPVTFWQSLSALLLLALVISIASR
ncbi:MAG: bifunctional protein-serine/threonine kinase/phosphatase [Gammaproteobacteria bacterium]|uniref:Serine/threonine protein kinase n=1 Tax=Marinobacter nitratireducens TaxID=1137280 RepID=A0A072MWZ3_9GAMM|nr:bifunctional protein-serine/threonine kinase/phosphatase [Marinobacter nitratireducens]KEF29939.1 Serine/threonine protein kinase [Marinobacter nitratireducens]TNE79252.1 MAG: bifunctional protein-serine/threonine kinase/phosphatase [Gammaproteobacteria bacterium]